MARCGRRVGATPRSRQITGDGIQNDGVAPPAPYPFIAYPGFRGDAEAGFIASQGGGHRSRGAPSPWCEPARECARSKRILRDRPGEEAPADASGPLEGRTEVSLNKRIAMGVRAAHGESRLTALVGLEEPHPGVRPGNLRRGRGVPTVRSEE